MDNVTRRVYGLIGPNLMESNDRGKGCVRWLDIRCTMIRQDTDDVIDLNSKSDNLDLASFGYVDQVMNQVGKILR